MKNPNPARPEPPDLDDVVGAALRAGGAVFTAHSLWLLSLGPIAKVGLALGLVNFPVGLGVAAAAVAVLPLAVKVARYAHARRAASQP